MKAALHDTIEQRHGSSKVYIVYGLGGAGKSQLVLSYIQRYGEDYRNAIWFDAAMKEAIERDFVQIYELVSDAPKDSYGSSVNADVAIDEVKRYFAERREKSLIIFDSADQFEDEEDPNFIDLHRFMPNSPNVDIIITTRSQSASAMSSLEPLHVTELTQSEAVDLFTQCSGVKDRSAETAEEINSIVTELGCLALAVTLAASYVATTPRLREDIRQYMYEYRQQRQQILGSKPRKLVHQYGASVLTTWEASCVAVAKKCPEAIDVLGFIACLNPDDIFLELFDIAFEHMVRRSSWWPYFSARRASKIGFDTAFQYLREYSLVQWNEQTRGYKMHKLVHDWAYERLTSREQSKFNVAVVAFLDTIGDYLYALPEVKTKGRVLPHVVSSFTRLKACEMHMQFNMDTLLALGFITNLAHQLGYYKLAAEIRQFECHHWKHDFPEERDWLIRGREAQAHALSNMGENRTAERILRDAIAMDDNTKVDFRHWGLYPVLAIVLRRQNRYSEAELVVRQCLERQVALLGRWHVKALETTLLLVHELSQQNRYQEALALSYHASDGFERTLGADDVLTVECVTQQGHLFAMLESYTEAEIMFERGLILRGEVTTRTLGNVLFCMWSMGKLRQKQGRFEEAKIWFESSISWFAESHGESHPLTVEQREKYEISKKEMQAELMANQKDPKQTTDRDSTSQGDETAA
jgi:tetratricopeptide (TPR) repeat protein